MTKAQKILIKRLISGCYLRPWISHAGTVSYRVYDKAANPVATVRTATVKQITKYEGLKKPLLKKDRHNGKLTLNLSHLRQLHGKTILKKEYKKNNSHDRSK